jgi:hypothetical protein
MKPNPIISALMEHGPQTHKQLVALTGMSARQVTIAIQRGLHRGVIEPGRIGAFRSYGIAGVNRRQRSPMGLTSPFRASAIAAAHLERTDCFGDAARVWLNAARQAVKPRNEEYCLNRSEFCSNAAIRGWSNIPSSFSGR